MNEDKFLINKTVYVAKEVKSEKISCEGCAFLHKDCCEIERPYCCSTGRQDGRDVIFVEEVNNG